MSLFKKELRQLMPLTIAVTSLTLLVILMVEMVPPALQSDVITSGYLLLLMPSLFAIGAGAMSIGQEKESRTLTWLASLPLAPQTLIRTKAATAVLILGCLWVIVFALGYLADRLNVPLQFEPNDHHPLKSHWAWHWILHSTYLLCCGYLAAWRMPSAMAGLVVVVPLALTPTMVRFAIAYALNPGHAWDSAQYDASWHASIISVVACIIAATLLMRRYALNSLSPAVSKVNLNPYAAVAVASDPRKRSTNSVPSPATALLWHFFRQNQWLYLSILGSCSLLAFLSIVTDDPDPVGSAFTLRTLTIIAVYVATAWMGVMVFQGDRVRDRIRFLADRGVSPRLTWTIRQLLPLAFIALMTWCYALFLHLEQSSLDFPRMVPVWIVLGSLSLFYVYGQWLSQITRHVAVSVIGAPLLGFIATISVIYSVGQVTVPYWTLIFALIAPMLATYLMMQRWMDGRRQWPFWACHAGLLLLVVLIPVGWFLATVSQVPSMPVSIRNQFESSTLPASVLRSPVYVSLVPSRVPDAWRIDGSKDDSPQLPSDFAAELQASIDFLKVVTNQSSTDASGISIDNEDIPIVMGEIELAKARLRVDPSDQSALEQFRQYFELLVLTAVGLRQASELIQQDQADAAEILLLAYMSQDATKKWLTDDLWRQAVAIVSDRDGRMLARKRALIYGWRRFHQMTAEDARKSTPMFNGYYWSLMSGEWSLLAQWTERARLDHLAATLMRLLETGHNLSEAERLDLLRQRWTVGRQGFDPWQAYVPMRINDPSDAFSPAFPNLMTPPLPGDQWFAGWEEVGANWREGE